MIQNATILVRADADVMAGTIVRVSDNLTGREPYRPAPAEEVPVG
jgi:hypothetical protein